MALRAALRTSPNGFRIKRWYPSGQPACDKPLNASMMVPKSRLLPTGGQAMPTLTYYGHSAVQLHDAKFTLLIDPFLSGNPVAPLKSSEIQKCDFILVTHGHADHLGDTIALAK